METESICDELLEEILSRLPVRDLLQLKCVSKSWCALIESNSFIKKQHQMQYAFSIKEGDIPFFLDSFSDNLAQFYILCEKRGDGVASLTSDLVRDSAPLFTNEPKLFNTLNCMGVVNGVVGLRWSDEHLGLRNLVWRPNEHLALWNPATREFKVVPLSRRSPHQTLPGNFMELYDSYGLGFDPKSNDFKIVRFMFWTPNGRSDMETLKSRYIYEMYSLSTNSWKNLEDPLPNLDVESSGTDGYFHGVYYWTTSELEPRTLHVQRYLLLAFDFSTELFKLLDPPSSTVMTKKYGCFKVGQYMEQLALIFSSVNHLEVWVVCKFDEDNRMPLSWQHLWISETTIPESRGIWSPIAFRIDGDLLLSVSLYNQNVLGSEHESILYKYNPSTGTFKKLGYSFGNCFRYVESLFPLSQKQLQISQPKFFQHKGFSTSCIASLPQFDFEELQLS